MTNRFKNAGITRAGFHYQDLFGLSILIDFYQDRDLYDWVKLESDGNGDGVDPGFLDDVVALRKADGLADVTQVKFCVDPARTDLALSADWLTKKKAEGSSLIGKWVASAKDLADKRQLGTARLLTNRRPDEVMAGALHGLHIRLDRLPADIRTRLVAEAGGEETAAWFFGIFEFHHSQPEPEDLELKLMYRLVPDDTDEHGWLLLQRTIMDWAIRKDAPREGGCIVHEDLHRILSTKRPRPLSQDFQVPQDYAPPDAGFHDRLRERLKALSTTVLFGAPGRGKSTYLSYLADAVRTDGQPVIRHHYFLNLGDTGPDRMGYADVASSLRTQLRDQISDLPLGERTTLREALEAAGQICGAVPLVVIIDGLDHVWRERDQAGADQMNHLFAELLPLPPNVVLLLGTQKVAAAQLPARLDRHTETGDWWELPPLSQAGVLAYLKGQADAGRLPGLEDRDQTNRDWRLGELAKAFHEIGGGHPLHLIYSVEEVLRRGQPILDHDVYALPRCPDGDIRTYYKELWRTLPQAGKDLLHLMAATDFLWPPGGMVECLGGAVTYLEAEAQILHMLDQRNSGVVPFHGSILAYIRETPEHAAAARRLLPQAVDWLRDRAPTYWREAWLWRTQARQGETAPLLEGPDRQWVTRMLCLGHPVDEIADTIAAAERAALDAGAWARLVTLRHLEIRLRNGPEYQASIWFDDFEEAMFRSLQDKTPLDIRSDALSRLPNHRILTLVRVRGDVHPDLPDAALSAAARRFNALRLFKEHTGELLDEATALLQITAHADGAKRSSMVRFARQFRSGAFEAHVEELVRMRKLGRLLDLMAEPDLPPAWQGAIADGCVRVACAEGIRLDKRVPDHAVLRHPLAQVFSLCMTGGAIGLPAAPLPLAEYGFDYEENNRSLAAFVHSWFFAAVATALRADGDFRLRPPPLPERRDGVWLRRAMAWLDNRATDLATRLERGEAVDITCFCQHLPTLPSEDGDPFTRVRFSGILQGIATDLHLISLASGKGGSITAQHVETLPACSPWSTQGWVSHLLKADPSLLSDDGTLRLLDLGERAQAEAVNELTERGDAFTALAQLAVRHGFDDRARACLEKAADCMTGYGYRKDPAIYDVMDAVEACHEAGCGTPDLWVATLVRPALAIIDYTDGSGTHHARKEVAQLVGKVAPHRLPALYQHTIAMEDWALADEVLTVVIKHADLSRPEVQALVRTTTESRHFAALQERAQAGDANAADLLAERHRLIGRLPNGSDRQSRAEDTPLPEDNDEAAPDPSAYPPGHVAEFVTKLGYRDRDYIRAWLEYWEKLGQGVEAIKDIRETFGGKGRTDLYGALDPAFDRAIDLLGKTEAFDILVKAHIQNAGWSAMLRGREDSLTRLRKAAHHYNDRWPDYVRRVARPLYGTRDEGSVVIGGDMFVRFLLMVGETELAAEVTEAMISDFIADLADLPIGPHLWTEAESDEP